MVVTCDNMLCEAGKQTRSWLFQKGFTTLCQKTSIKFKDIFTHYNRCRRFFLEICFYHGNGNIWNCHLFHYFPNPSKVPLNGDMKIWEILDILYIKLVSCCYHARIEHHGLRITLKQLFFLCRQCDSSYVNYHVLLVL